MVMQNMLAVTSTGLSEQRSSLENDYNRAFQKAGQLGNATSRSNESGDALQIRVAAQTATLPEIALAGAEGLSRVLRIMAEWMGGNPDEVVVTPNLEFADQSGDGMTLKQVIESKVLGAPIFKRISSCLDARKRFHSQNVRRRTRYD